MGSSAARPEAVRRVLGHRAAAATTRRVLHRLGLPPAPRRASQQTWLKGPGRSPAPAAVFDWIDRRTELRRCAGLTRHLRPRPADEPVLDLAGNDYLGLVRHPRVVRAATEAVARWGGVATGSRLVT
ncbi:hypothetical protein ACFWMG_47050, partial [Streptomyces sp. NPDC127074]